MLAYQDQIESSLIGTRMLCLGLIWKNITQRKSEIKSSKIAKIPAVFITLIHLGIYNEQGHARKQGLVVVESTIQNSKFWQKVVI